MLHEFVHDFLLAKEIVAEVLQIAQEKKLSKITAVTIEIGQVAMAHDGFAEHAEDISVENLQFGIESLSRDTILKAAKIIINKIPGEHWKITELNGE